MLTITLSRDQVAFLAVVCAVLSKRDDEDAEYARVLYDKLDDVLILDIEAALT